MVNIYYARISEKSHNRLIEKYLSCFSTVFQDRLGRFRRWEDAQLSLLGRVLLVNGLEQLNHNFDDSEIKYTYFNKPYLDGNDVFFNISHSGSFVVCALTKSGEIGIDIEKMDSIEISSFKSQMTSNEWEVINESKNQVCSFYTYWSQKEAVIKAHGEGLSIALKSFEVKNNETTIDSEKFYLQEISISDEYSCFIAFKEKIKAMDIKICKINF